MQPDLLLHPHADALAARLAPFVDADALGPLEVHVADTLGTRAGEASADVLLAVALAVRAPTRGHICVPLGQLSAAQLLPEGADPAVAEGLALPTDRAAWCRQVAASPLVGPGRPLQLDGDRLYTARYHSYELGLAAALRRRVTTRLTVAAPDLLRTGLDALFQPTAELDRQRLGATTALLRGLTVIAGGPGTGKTYTVRSVLALLWAQWASATDGAGSDRAPGPRVALAAPTGKAAARMRESILTDLPRFLATASGALPPHTRPDDLGRFLTGLTPSTLHRLLGVRADNPTRFRHDADHPLPHDVVIVDEASMVDFALMAKLVDAVAPRARLILLGDKHQLASVEAGTVLADITGDADPDAPTLSTSFAADLEATGLTLHGVARAPAPGPQDAIALLTRSRRFDAGSGIGRFARACLADPPRPADAIALFDAGTPDITLLRQGAHHGLTPDALAAIVDGYRPYLRRLLDGPAPDQPLPDFHRRVLEQFERFRVLAAHRRGALGVSGLNPTIASALADAVPGFDPLAPQALGRPVLVRRNDPVVGRFNGDIGVLVDDAAGRRVAAFIGDGGVQYLAPARLPEHQTVFAMTIHKSQGSEFDHALIVLPSRPSPILTRELIYTGATRARRRMTLLGSDAVLTDALQRRVERASGLRERLWTPSSPSAEA